MTVGDHIEVLRDIDRALALADKSNKIDRKRVVGMAVIKHIAAIRTALSARASAGEGGWPARWFASGPMGEFFTPNHAFAETLIRGMKYDRDDWTITDLSEGDTCTAAPQPAQAGASSGDRPSDDALMGPDAPPHIRLLLHMKHGPRVHGMACDDPAFKARHDAAIDAAVDAMLAAAPQPQEDEKARRPCPRCDTCNDLIVIGYCRDCARMVREAIDAALDEPQ